MTPTTWTEHRRALALLRPALSDHGIPDDRAEPLRIANNAVWRIHGTGTVWKATPQRNRDQALHSVSAAQWLEENDIPAVRLATGPCVYEDDKLIVTMWQDIGDHHEGTPEAAADILLRLHEIPPPAWFPHRTPQERSFVHIDQTTWASADDIAAITDMLDDEDEQAGLLFDPEEETALHGNPWPGHFVVGEDGVTRLIDLERMARGNPLYDLSPTAAKATWIGQYDPRIHQRLATAYGVDVTTTDQWRHLRTVEMLQAVCYAIAVAEHNTAARDAAQHRIDCLLGREGDGPYEWPALPVRPDGTDS